MEIDLLVFVGLTSGASPTEEAGDALRSVELDDGGDANTFEDGVDQVGDDTEIGVFF